MQRLSIYHREKSAQLSEIEQKIIFVAKEFKRVKNEEDKKRCIFDLKLLNDIFGIVYRNGVFTYENYLALTKQEFCEKMSKVVEKH